ncbi:unnamed protein product, partial [Effrenium voratum]
MYLPRSVLLETVLKVNPSIKGTNKMNKVELANIVTVNWRIITEQYAKEAGLLSIYDDQDDTSPEVVIPFENEMIKVFYKYDTTSTGTELLRALNAWFVADLTPDTCLLKVGDSLIYSYETIHAYVFDKYPSLSLLPKLRGGTLQRWKKPLNKAEALKQMVDKSKDTIIRKIDTTLVMDIQEAPPVSFAQVIAQIDNKVADFREKMMTGELTMERVVNQLTDEQIDVLERVFAFKTSEKTEQKVIDAVNIIYKDATAIDDVLPHLKRAKMGIVLYHNFHDYTKFHLNDNFH